MSNLLNVCLKEWYFRCDQSTDCKDISDEKGCQIVVIDLNNYMKDKPPKEALVKLSVDLLKILKIDEVAMLYKTQYSVNMEWLDPRIISEWQAVAELGQAQV